MWYFELVELVNWLCLKSVQTKYSFDKSGLNVPFLIKRGSVKWMCLYAERRNNTKVCDIYGLSCVYLDKSYIAG